MFSSHRVSYVLTLYATFVVATAVACHSLFQTTATKILSKPHSKSAAVVPTYSRVELWLKKQSSAKKKPAMFIQAAVQNVIPAPEHELARAVVLAAAMDSTEHNPNLQVASRLPRASSQRLRNRVPTCDELPCVGEPPLPAVAAKSKPDVALRGKAKPLRVAANAGITASKALQRIAPPAQIKIASKSLSKPLKPQKVAAQSKAERQARLKLERKIALRRYRETPAEISYRSFVGHFVPAS